jgi:hypothetical protein
MSNYEKLILNSIYSNPLALMAVEDPDTIARINSYLPFSTGFEIECNQLPSFDVTDFESIPYIMAVNCDSWEQRFRIPPGIKGFICLYSICEKLKTNSSLNLSSGIHYHIDMSDVGNEFIFKPARKKHILEELDSWKYQGNYNDRRFSSSKGNWVRFPTYNNSVEIRIGEMSFDYRVLVKRIIHCNKLILEAKQDKEGYLLPVNTETVDKELIINFFRYDNSIMKRMNRLERLNQELKELKVEEHASKLLSIKEQEEKAIVSKRVFKI